VSISMYQASVPSFIRGLTNAKGICDKASAHAQAHKIEPSVLLNGRLFPNMFPFTRQIQIASDFAKGTTARLAGIELPKYEDSEASFGELSARIDKTLAFIAPVKPQLIDGSETRAIEITAGGQVLKFTGLTYLLTFSLPNFYFHLTTAYAILRHAGVDLAKRDFIGPL
jgi:hypothetical protein